MIGIETAVDYKAKMYKNEFCRKKKVDDEKHQDLARRKRKLPVLG
jgi:hypothetical protein